MKFKNHRSVIGKEKDLETWDKITVPYFRLVRNEQSAYINSETYLRQLRKYQENKDHDKMFQLDKIQFIGSNGRIMIESVNSLPAQYFPKTHEYFTGLEKRTVN